MVRLGTVSTMNPNPLLDLFLREAVSERLQGLLEARSRGDTIMTQRKILEVLAIVPVMMLATACSGRNAGNGSATSPAASIPSPAVRLSGTWRGEYHEVSSHRTGTPIGGSMVLRINDDGTFTTTSARRPPRTGRVTVTESRVILDSSETGSRVILMRSGNTLYSVTYDELTGANLAIRLEKIEQPGQ